MGGCPASLPSDNGNDQSPGLCHCQWHGSWANRSASRPRRSRCQLKRRWHWFTWRQLKPWSTKGRNVAPGMTYLGLRPLEGCSWGCTSWCWGWWTWRCWRSSGQGSGDSRPPADGLQRSQRPLWSLRSRCSLEKSHLIINLGKIPRSLGFYIPVKPSRTVQSKLK